MKEQGTRYTCDRCDKEEFMAAQIKTLPNGREVDEAPMPDGWNVTASGDYLCQSCFEKYERLRAEFFGKKK